MSMSLELQSGFAGRVGQRLHAAVIPITGAVERDRVDAERLRAIADAFADERRGGLVCAGIDNH